MVVYVESGQAIGRDELERLERSAVAYRAKLAELDRKHEERREKLLSRIAGIERQLTTKVYD